MYGKGEGSMPLKVTNQESLERAKDFSFGAVNNDGDVVGAKGGTEMMKQGLIDRLPASLLDEVNLICSRVRDVSPDKPNIYWLHDLASDPEAEKGLQQRDKFAKLVFVSNWQWTTYHILHNLPYTNSVVMKNAIEPIPGHEKPRDRINIIYHTTPHRGLELLVPAVEHLATEMEQEIHLDVYSGFEIYKPYEPLFDRIKAHPNMTYHGVQSNDVVRRALEDAHIFGFPSIWQETSCIAAMEAMSAGCAIVHSTLAALPETTAGFGLAYPMYEDPEVHCNHFAFVLRMAIEAYWDEQHQQKLKFQKMYADNFYNWDGRAAEWRGLLEAILSK